MSVVHALCAVCGGEAFRQLYPGTIADPEAAPEAYFGSFRSQTGYYPIVSCERCGLRQMRPRDDDATLARAYGALPADVEHQLDVAARKLADSQTDLLTRHRAAPARLLDVGAGAGCFLEAASARGYDAGGLEPSAECVRLVRERVPSARMVHGSIESANIASGSYDIVTLWDVLEHLTDPRATVRRLASWLSPGGLLALQLPDGNSLPARLFGASWPLLLREHLTYFDVATMTRLLETEGYRVVTIGPCLRYFPLAHLATRLRQAGVPVGRLGEAIGRRVIAAPAGEMRVVARKLA